MAVGLLNLPNELLQIIADALPTGGDLLAFANTCRRTRACTQKEDVWRAHFKREVGRDAYEATLRETPEQQRVWRRLYAAMAPALQRPMLVLPPAVRSHLYGVYPEYLKTGAATQVGDTVSLRYGIDELRPYRRYRVLATEEHTHGRCFYVERPGHQLSARHWVILRQHEHRRAAAEERSPRL